ncbi:hypothetical protein B0O80DRAFT_226862 [Mortierella sp. GBAus27b]|nr:hypothetical protein B0O80DRAFT_226862 [Mortierella sp. GBAus27b]
MIVDHLVTRSVVRSVTLVFTAIAPVAAGYFLYMAAYKETPIDTLVHQIPLALKLIQGNTTTIATATTTQLLYLPAPHVTASAAAVSPLSSISAGSASMGALSSSAVDCYYGGSNSNNHSPPHHLPQCETDTFNLSPAINSLVALASLLDYYGYNHPKKIIPGYQYLTALLHPLQEQLSPLLQPVMSFIASDTMLTWMTSIVHFWFALEVLFYLHFWSRLGQAQTIDRVPKGPKNRQERKELFRKCLETIGKGPRAKRWAETWFDTGKTSQPVKFEDIGRSNMMQW